MNKFNQEGGFIGIIILIIIGLAALKYFFDWSIFDVLNSEKGRETLTYLRNFLKFVWDFIKSIFQ